MTMALVMATRARPTVAGMPTELWTWLSEAKAVRPHVVAQVRASLDAGL